LLSYNHRHDDSGDDPLNCSVAALTLFLLAPCDNGGGESIDLAIAESLASPDRLEQDLKNDPLRRPDLILGFFGIQPGMTVLDLFSGGGYYTEIVSRVVGESGKVVAHNNQAYLDYARDTIQPRYRDDRLPNVERVTSEANDLVLPRGAFDAALVMLTWHDLYYVDPENGWPAIDPEALTKKLCSALKPGAVLGISDHVARTGTDVPETAQALHRIDPARIKADLSGTCFEFEGEINVLRNPQDDHEKPMYAEGIRGRTDRVVYRFRRT
jgi:predicted methyltransferase